MQIPTKQECYQLICEMEMLDNIVIHSIQVCRVALFLAEQLEKKEVYLDTNLVQASALLHDITKTRSLETGEPHDRTGDQLLQEHGYPEVGNIIGQHVRLADYSDASPPTAAEIVNYSDKRVLHDQITPLSERMKYILERYGKKPEYRERIWQMWRKTEQVENKLFRWLSFSPQEIRGFLGDDGYTEEFSEYEKMKNNGGKK